MEGIRIRRSKEKRTRTEKKRTSKISFGLDSNQDHIFTIRFDFLISAIKAHKEKNPAARKMAINTTRGNEYPSSH
jgi:hypothetical protein